MQPKFFTKQHTLGADFTDTSIGSGPGSSIISDPYAPITLRKLDPIKDVINYELAVNTYATVYNNMQYRGKEELEKKGGIKTTIIAGKPMSITFDNMFPLLNEEYYVSTKADGLRFIMMISNDIHQARKDRGILASDEIKFTHKAKRFIFFIDMKLNFWIIESTNKIQDHIYLMDLDKCLIDGELLFFADHVETYKNKETNTIDKYVLSINSRNRGEYYRPYIIFLAFDILFGPINPTYEYERHEIKGIDLSDLKKVNETYTFKTEVKDTTLIFGSSNNIVSHKANKRWNCRNRRLILQQMFINTCSPLHNQFKRIASVANFTVLLSPFFDFNDVIKEIDPYSYSKDIYITDIDEQFQKINGYSIRNLPDSGLGTDGIILTPINEDYLDETWSLGNNKQYKWKPKEELTIDVRIDSKNISSLVHCYVGSGKVPYKFNNRDVLISIEEFKQEIEMSKDPVIVECVYQDSNLTQDIIFTIKKLRPDKLGPNSRSTVEGILDQLVGKSSEYNILDIVKKLRTEIKESSKESSRESSKEKSTKNNFNLYNLLSDDSQKRIILMSDPINYLNKNGNGQFISELLDLVSERVMYKSFRSDMSDTSDISVKTHGHEKNSYELEARIDLDDKRDIEQVLIKGFLKEDYESRPMVRFFKKQDYETYRATFVELGTNNLLLQDISTKKKINSVRMPNFYKNLYHRVLKIETTLSNENILDDNTILSLMSSDKIVYDIGIINDLLEKGFDSEYSKEIMDSEKFKKFLNKIIEKEKEQAQSSEQEQEKEQKSKSKRSLEQKEEALKKYAKILLKENKKNEMYNSVDNLVKGISSGETFYGTFHYQTRHIINCVSDYWTVEIIKYAISSGQNSSYENAYELYMKGPNVDRAQKTRIEIEYKPLEYYNEILKYVEHYGKNTPEYFIYKFANKFNVTEDLKKLSDSELYLLFKKKLHEEHKKITNQDPMIILNDYLKLIFRILYCIYY